MARTAYHYVKTLDFASDVALGMDSLSPKFVSSPLPKDSSRRLLLRAGVAGEVLGQNLDNYGREAPIDTREVTLEHFPRQTLSSSNVKKEFCYPELDVMFNPVGQNAEPTVTFPGNGSNVNPMFSIIDFRITSPSKIVSCQSIKDFNNNYDPNCYEHSTLKTISNSATGHRVEYEKEFPGQQDLLSNFIKSEPIEASDYALLEKGVACFLKKCKEEVVSPQNPLPNCTPYVMTGVCKNEQGASSSNDDTGIGSLDDYNLTISDYSLDGKGIQYVSELKGTILRIRKLSKKTDTLKKTARYADLQKRMMNLEANVKYLKLQANGLKKKVQLRNRRVTNLYHWSRSSRFNKAA